MDAISFRNFFKYLKLRVFVNKVSTYFLIDDRIVYSNDESWTEEFGIDYIEVINGKVNGVALPKDRMELIEQAGQKYFNDMIAELEFHKNDFEKRVKGNYEVCM